MSTCSYEIIPRPAELGGGWRLRFIENGEEVGGGVFPLGEYASDGGAAKAANDASECAYIAALDEAEAWIASRDRGREAEFAARFERLIAQSEQLQSRLADIEEAESRARQSVAAATELLIEAQELVKLLRLAVRSST